MCYLGRGDSRRKCFPGCTAEGFSGGGPPSSDPRAIGLHQSKKDLGGKKLPSSRLRRPRIGRSEVATKGPKCCQFIRIRCELIPEKTGTVASLGAFSIWLGQKLATHPAENCTQLKVQGSKPEGVSGW